MDGGYPQSAEGAVCGNDQQRGWDRLLTRLREPVPGAQLRPERYHRAVDSWSQPGPAG